MWLPPLLLLLRWSRLSACFDCIVCENTKTYPGFSCGPWCGRGGPSSAIHHERTAVDVPTVRVEIITSIAVNSRRYQATAPSASTRAPLATRADAFLRRVFEPHPLEDRRVHPLTLCTWLFVVCFFRKSNWKSSVSVWNMPGMSLFSKKLTLYRSPRHEPMT